MMEKENIIPFNLNIPVTPSPRKHSLDSPQKRRLTGRKSKSNDSPTKSPSRTPIASKISFFEKQEGLNTSFSEALSWHFPEVKDKIEFYEKMFMGGTPMKGQPRRDVLVKHEEWKKMLSDMLAQVQEKASQVKACEEKMRANEECYATTIHDLQQERDNKTHENEELKEQLCELEKAVARDERGNSAIVKLQDEIIVKTLENEELKQQIADLEKSNSVLAAQAAQDKHYSQCAEDKVEQLMVDLIAEQEKLMAEQERLMLEQEKSKRMQDELDARNTEIEMMSKKLVNRNAELKLYKSKVEHFLGLLETRTSTPNKKRMSICSESSTSSSASKKPRPSPAFSCPSPRFEYKFDPTRYETNK
eukprot:Phypoly_transcript_10776.p1 GENE.Phypoly_transcript_10776~~Phypoly_transcript_10776.p1  ORF type:complete len:361 (+),score=77.20 Phypoly_transcript_10776:164-1246(+)